MPLPFLVEKHSFFAELPLLQKCRCVPSFGGPDSHTTRMGRIVHPSNSLSVLTKKFILMGNNICSSNENSFPPCCCLFLKFLSSCVELCSQMQISISFTMFAGWIPVSVWTSRKVYHINIAGIQWEDQNPCCFEWHVKVCFCSWNAEILTSSSSSLSPANWNSSAQWFCTLMILWLRVNNQVNANHTTEIRMLQSIALVFG